MRQMANMTSSERTTVVRREQLLQALVENRKKHIDNYNEAVDGYLIEANKKLDAQYLKAQSKLEEAYTRTKQELKRFDPTKARDVVSFCESLHFNLIAPRNYTAAYDQAILMVQWDTRNELELTASEFRCFIMDEWDWMEEFIQSTQRYSMAAMRKA